MPCTRPYLPFTSRSGGYVVNPDGTFGTRPVSQNLSHVRWYDTFGVSYGLLNIR